MEFIFLNNKLIINNFYRQDWDFELLDLPDLTGRSRGLGYVHWHFNESETTQAQMQVIQKYFNTTSDDDEEEIEPTPDNESLEYLYADEDECAWIREGL